MTIFRKHIQTRLGRREPIFLVLSGTSAICFFLSSLILVSTIPTSEFAIVASVLAISLVLASLMQFGSDTNLPRRARINTAELSSMVGAHLTIVLIFSALMAIMMKIFYSNIEPQALWVMAWSIAVGSAAACQYVCDSYLRSRGEIFRIAITNLILGVISLSLTLLSALNDVLTPQLFLSITLSMRVIFCISVMCQKVFKFKFSIRPILQSVRATPTGFLGAILLLSLGMLDNILLISIINSHDVAAYISTKHFAYGVFIAAVQEGSMPILIAYLVRAKHIDLRILALFAIGHAVIVFFAAFILGVYVNNDDHHNLPDRTFLILLVSTGIGFHVLATFAIRTLLVTSVHDCKRLCGLAIITIAIVMIIAINLKIELMNIVLIWISLNAWMAGGAFYLLTKYRSKSIKIRTNSGEITT